MGTCRSRELHLTPNGRFAACVGEKENAERQTIMAIGCVDSAQIEIHTSRSTSSCSLEHDSSRWYMTLLYTGSFNSASTLSSHRRGGREPCGAGAMVAVDCATNRGCHASRGHTAYCTGPPIIKIIFVLTSCIMISTTSDTHAVASSSAWRAAVSKPASTPSTSPTAPDSVAVMCGWMLSRFTVCSKLDGFAEGEGRNAGEHTPRHPRPAPAPAPRRSKRYGWNDHDGCVSDSPTNAASATFQPPPLLAISTLDWRPIFTQQTSCARSPR